MTEQRLLRWPLILCTMAGVGSGHAARGVAEMKTFDFVVFVVVVLLGMATLV